MTSGDCGSFLTNPPRMAPTVFGVIIGVIKPFETVGVNPVEGNALFQSKSKLNPADGVCSGVVVAVVTTATGKVVGLPCFNFKLRQLFT